MANSPEALAAGPQILSCEPQIAPLTGERLDEAIEAIAEAFQGSDLYGWIAGHEPGSALFVKKIFEYRVRLGSAYGETDLALEDGAVIGAAVWTPPAGHKGAALAASALKELGTMEAAVKSFSEETKRRWLGFFNLFLGARDKVISQPYWALTPIAVRGHRQGLKVASKLIRPRLARMDEEGVPCFLGVQEPLCRDIYLHYGFKAIREDKILDSGQTSWSMVRRPGAAFTELSG
ncbi:MAG: puromycin N-acetyltransferase [Deltaproteobacteria bacterium]|jgi:GNAT superfamily N-acetyltransferase|nr:puromycin N-acetyltransferase [Deltaproteobacteria bacterium]